MEKEITINGLTFVPYISRDEIREQVSRVAGEIRRDLSGCEPVFLCVLNGSFIFAADLIREVGIDDCHVCFVRYSSYEGMNSSGKIKQLIGLTEELEGKDVVIVEDIVDTGLTASNLMDDLRRRRPRSLRFATLLHKPECTKTGFIPDYVAFSIHPRFIVGYGLDLDGKARNLPDIYVIKEETEDR
ncbi:MAG: hypoxanthine phosphoribosyltransferase [Bacteroidales bacterium]|nr:hypoxanthine phosphoribosyltransferase [Bacteroidales bacterium]